ncbi:MAG TPA: recombinase family protein [Pirellulales bacterium]|nr:recombinase family protein [Pirellulales bacterium]
MSKSDSPAVATVSCSSPVSPKADTGSQLASAKIRDQHLARLAIVYVRQSTPQQVNEHRESLMRQYAFRDRALALGWASDRILVIDEDLGLSGRSAENRTGFQRLLSEMTLDHVGIVLGLEMGRLARSSMDWHQLFELCGIFGALLADEDGVYNASDPNDRLILGLKGIMSEMELLTMRNRLHRGMLNKAQRGELFLHVPVGYVNTPTGAVALDPDEQVRTVVHLIFEKFNELGSGHAVHRYFRRHGIRMGVRPIDGPNKGQLEWRPPSHPLIFTILKHPLYAGAYAFGRCPVVPKRKRTHKVPHQWVPAEEWKVLLHNRAPAYITWDQYLANQLRLKENRTKSDSKGSIRKWAALLGGVVFCGQCGHKLCVYYQQSGRPRYE